MSSKRNNSDSEDEEESIRQRIAASEKERIKRGEERALRKKDRRNRVEKIIYQDPVLTANDKLELQKESILEELERREKILESKMEAMEEKIIGNSQVKNKEMEDNIVNNFINKLAIEHYNKLDEKLKKLSITLNSKIDGLANKNQKIENSETKTIKSMFVAIQNQMKILQENVNKQEEKRDKEKKDEELDEGKYDQLQDQINDLTLLLSTKDNEADVKVDNLEEKIKNMKNENINEMYLEMDRKIDLKLKQDNRLNEIFNKISQMEDIHNNDNIDNILENVIEQINFNNDDKIKKMYSELRFRINNVENMDHEQPNERERGLIDLEKRLVDIEMYKKRLEQEDEKRKKRIERQRLKDEKRDKKFSRLKNKILNKHKLGKDEDGSEEEELKELVIEQVIVPITFIVHPYIELLEYIKKKGSPKILEVCDSKGIEVLNRDLNRKYERYRGKALKGMLLVKNKLKNIKSKNAYGIKRGTIELDSKEGERVKIFKRYNGLIKDRFIYDCKIYFTYYHNFNFTFENTFTNELLTLYYDSNVNPKMVVVSFKTKYGNKLKKYNKKINIGTPLIMDIKNYEDNNGEHLDISFLGFNVKFEHMLRIINIESNCYFEVELEFNDDELFDI